jgi:hypothetical protein
MAVVMGVGVGMVWGENAESIRAHYAKFEYRIPMRDGVRLFTAVYVPYDGSKPAPILMRRTPYSVGPYGADQYPERLGPSDEFASEGYIFVEQDVRGRFMSEGEFVNMRPHRSLTGAEVDESTDTYDTIEWLLENIDGHNGRVGLWGNSYPGFYASYGAIDSHPALEAVLPSAPIADWFFDDMHHHGAFVLSLSFGFFSAFGQPRDGLTTEWPERFDYRTPDGYQFFLDLGPLANVNRDYFHGEIPFWNEIVAHPNYDEFWQSRAIVPHLKGVDCAVMVVGGWFDAEDLYGPLHTYAAMEENNPGASSTLVMGPWRHGAWLRSDGRELGPVDFGFATGEWFREELLVPFFRTHLWQEGELETAEATVFETGANRWRRFSSWPPESATPAMVYLAADGRLTFEPEALKSEEAQPDAGFDDYVSDPENPVPYTPAITTRWHSEYMVEDQRFAGRRPDVLVYRSDVLEEDVTVAGPITARLWVSTTGQDADWVVKVIDEYPGEVPGIPGASEDREGLGGTQRMVRSEIFRGRFRESYSAPKPFAPGQPTEVVIPLQDVLHTFQRGHRIMVQIQSSLFPFIDRNPQSWVDNIFEASEEDFIRATHRVYRAPEYPSRLEIQLLAED